MNAFARRLLVGLAILLSVSLPVMAAPLALLTGPQPAGDLASILNTLITNINASSPYTGAFTVPITDTYTSGSATPGTVRAITGSASVGSALTMTSGNLVGARGDVTIPSGTTVGNSTYLYGVQGKAIGGGTLNGNIAGVVGQWDYSTGTFASGINSVIWADAGSSASASAAATDFGGHSQLLRLTNTTAALTSQVIDIYANANYFMSIGAPAATAAYFQTAGTAGTSCGVSGGAVAAKVLEIVGPDGNDYWIPLCDSNS
jgi:hypothetical protein